MSIAIRGIAAALAVGFVVSGPAEATDITVSAWTPQFFGVDSATANLSSSVAYLERIDLWNPFVHLTVTPHSGSLQTTAQTTSQFLLQTHTQIAFNTNFFAPCCDAFTEPKSLVGLSISNGTMVSPQALGDNDAAASLLVAPLLFAAILPPTTSPVNLAGIYNAVSGNLIVSQGQNVSSVVPVGAPHDPFGLDPRTDIGLSWNDRYLYVAVIDGREPGHSAGVTTSDAADLLIKMGVYEGLNLDGGGSTALVRSDGKGGAVDINEPSGGSERFVGSNLGVYALPLLSSVLH